MSPPTHSSSKTKKGFGGTKTGTVRIPAMVVTQKVAANKLNKVNGVGRAPSRGFGAPRQPGGKHSSKTQQDNKNINKTQHHHRKVPRELPLLEAMAALEFEYADRTTTIHREDEMSSSRHSHPPPPPPPHSPPPPPHSPPPEPVLPPPTQAQIQRQQIRLQQQQQIRQMELLQEEEQLQQQQTPNQIKSKAAGLEELYDFVEKHSTYYQGAIPSRDYLSDAGRADLVKVVRRLGGARAAAAALTNYKAEVLDTRVTPSSPRTTPTVAKPDSEVSSQVAETSMAHEYLREGTLPALQKRARRPYSARLRAAERRVPPEPVWARMGKQQANMSRDAFAREVESALSRDLCLMIEHHTTGRETDGFWTLWRTPLKAPTAEVSDVLDAAEACARHYPTHFIRAAAFDNAKGGAQTIALTYHVPTDTVEPNQ